MWRVEVERRWCCVRGWVWVPARGQERRGRRQREVGGVCVEIPAASVGMTEKGVCGYDGAVVPEWGVEAVWALVLVTGLGLGPLFRPGAGSRSSLGRRKGGGGETSTASEVARGRFPLGGGNDEGRGRRVMTRVGCCSHRDTRGKRGYDGSGARVRRIWGVGVSEAGAGVTVVGGAGVVRRAGQDWSSAAKNALSFAHASAAASAW